MLKKTERYYITYDRVNADDWISMAAKLTGLTSDKFGLYLVTVS